MLAHSPSLNQTCWDLNSDYSDRLLATLYPREIPEIDEEFLVREFGFF